jgi:hypothetical protein
LNDTDAIFGFGLTSPTGFRSFYAVVIGFSLPDCSGIGVIATGILAITTNQFASGRPYTIGIR